MPSARNLDSESHLQISIQSITNKLYSFGCVVDKSGYGDTETPRCTLLWPTLKPDTSDPINKRLKKIDNPPLINHASLSPDMKYLIACTDNNLVCIWSRADISSATQK